MQFILFYGVTTVICAIVQHLAGEPEANFGSIRKIAYELCRRNPGKFQQKRVNHSHDSKNDKNDNSLHFFIPS